MTAPGPGRDAAALAPGPSRPPRAGDPIARADQMRAIDARAIGELGVPGAVLMENAGRACAERLARLAAAGVHAPRALVLCGPGNNGGDGLVVARALEAWGWSVETRYVGDPDERSRLSDEARLQLELADRLGRAPRSVQGPSGLETLERDLSDLVRAGGVAVDALFGTGLARPLAGDFAGAVERLVASGAAVLAIDLPSGLCADTGRVLGVACPARYTTTLAALKPGLVHGLAQGPGPDLAGELELAEIGVPAALLVHLARLRPDQLAGRGRP